MIPSLNDLRVVELSGLMLHEAHDADRLARLRARMASEGVQRNPVIVSPCNDRYLILDGAHRFRALQELGCELVLVQLVELPDTIESWQHLVRGFERRSLRDAEEIEVSENLAGAPVAVLEARGGHRVFVRARGEGLLAEVRALRHFQALYPDGSTVRRLAPEEEVKLAGGETLVRYRSFTPRELIKVVAAGAVLPAGITRFRVPERVLGVRFPLEKLREGDVGARNAELAKLVKKRWDENRIRYYGEPVVLFE